MTSRYSIYIPIGITYAEYKPEYFAAHIDIGAGTCLCKPTCFPETYKRRLPHIGGRDISNIYIRLEEGIPEAKIIIGEE